MNKIELLKSYLLTEDISKYEKELFELIPALKYENGFEQNNPWHEYDVWHHTVAAVNGCDMNFEDRLTLLLHDVGKPFSYQDDESGVRHFHNHAIVSAKMAVNILKSIGIEEQISSQIISLIQNHSSKINLEQVNEQNIDYYLRLIKIQKCDGFAYEKEHAYKILKKLSVQEDYLINIVKRKSK